MYSSNGRRANRAGEECARKCGENKAREEVGVMKIVIKARLHCLGDRELSGSFRQGSDSIMYTP